MTVLNRLGEVWHGRRPVAETFWVWYLLGNVALNIVGYITMKLVIGAQSKSTTQLALYGLLFFAVVAAQLCYGVFSLVALWRSASREGSGGFIYKVLTAIAAAWATFSFGRLIYALFR